MATNAKATVETIITFFMAPPTTPGYASLPACSSGERRIDRNQTPEVASLESSDYCLRACASGHKRAAGLQWVFRPRLRAGSDAYPGAIQRFSLASILSAPVALI